MKKPAKPMKAYKIALPLELASAIDQDALREGRPPSDYIRVVLDRWIFGVSRRYALEKEVFLRPKRAPRINITAADRAEIFRRDGGQCAYCDGPLKFDESWHIDHIKPLSKGGTNDIDNLAVSCPRCNLKKSAKEIA